MQIRWLLQAADDLESIHEYLREHHPPLAESTMNAIYQSILSLEVIPFRGRPTRKPDVRQLVLPRLPYSVFYRVKDQMIEILYIRHGAQDRSAN